MTERGVSIVPLSALPPASERRLATCTLRPAVLRRIGILHLASRPLSSAARAMQDSCPFDGRRDGGPFPMKSTRITAVSMIRRAQ